MIPFNDLKPRYEGRRDEFRLAVERVFDRGWFILGPELSAFESEFAAWHGGGHAVGVASGTDAIELALRAAGVGPGDEVITVAMTAVATVCAVERAGAKPVLVDIDPRTCTIDPARVAAAITPRTKAIVPVHLYGRVAAMDELNTLAHRHGLAVIEDCAQAHGATSRGRKAGTLGDLAAFSFYPTKNLGAFGDAGAVLTASPLHAERLLRLRNYGQTLRYHHAEPGVNSRLDEIQAALLRTSLPRLDADVAERRRLAAVYDVHLRNVTLPAIASTGEHAYHLYAIRHPRRDQLRDGLRERGVETLSHYPVPVHLQPAFARLGMKPGSLPATERAAAETLSLPLYPGLSNIDQRHVIDAVNAVAEELR